MSDLPNLADIREFIFEHFDDDELETLCFDYFPRVRSNFTSGMLKMQKIRHLLDHCSQFKLLDNLLAAIQKARPEQYKERFPQAPKVQARPEPAKLVHDPKQVFVCHAYEDADFAHRLANDLQQNGWRVWIAPDSIQPGEKWAKAIDRGLNESGVFLIVLTPDAVRSKWVEDEAYAAIELENRGHVRFVPLDVKPCSVPPLWSTRQQIPFQGDYGRGLTALLNTLERERRVREAQEKATHEEATHAAQKVKPSEHVNEEARLAAEKAEAERLARETAERLEQERQTRARVRVVASVMSAVVILIALGSLVRSALNSHAVTKTVTQTPFPIVTRIAEKDSMVMVYVPAGEFLMGSTDSDKDAYSNEKPQHKVYLDAFWIDQTEVSNAQYKQCVQAQKCKASSYADNAQFNRDTLPVVGVDWNDAKSYCEWAGRHLPTEAQWEKAARGTDGRTYPWGSTMSNDLTYQRGDHLGPTEVNANPAGASPYGALNMVGNAWEWIADWYDEKYYGSSSAKSPNPQGPSSGQYRVLRGGSWYDEARNVRAANRGLPGSLSKGIGFRCAY